MNARASVAYRLKVSLAREAVLNLQKAIKNTSAPGALYDALRSQLVKAQARLAELTGSVEP